MIAHELAHVKHRDILLSSVAATVAATIILAPLAALLIPAAISRSREFVADRGGGRDRGRPARLADALPKIDVAACQVPLNANPATVHMFIMKPFSGRGMMALFSTHPATEQRIWRLLQPA